MSRFKETFYSRYVSSHFESSKLTNPTAYKDYERYYKQTLTRFLPEDKDSSLLDIGCGLGHLLYFLKEQGYANHFGIDMGREQIDICRKLVTENVELVTDTIDFLSKNLEKYETVFLFDVLEHIDDDELFPFLDAIRGSLPFGGKLIISVPNAACFTTLVTLYADMTHSRLFSEHSLKQLLRVEGFKKIDVFPHEKKVIRSFRSRRERYLWQMREKLVRWLLSEFHLHLMEGSYPEVQTVNILCVAEK